MIIKYNTVLIIVIIAGTAYTSAHFGAGSGNVWLEDVACSSTNTKILQCSSSPIGQDTCTHSEDAGVGCEGTAFTIINNDTLYLYSNSSM